MDKVLGTGTACIDFLVHIDHLPTRKDEGARILQTSWQGGGKVASALAAFGQLGGQGAMMGVTGADSYGDFLVADFHRYHIDTSHLIQDGACAFSLVLSDQVTKGRNIIGRSSTGRPYTLEDIDEDFVRSFRMLHLEAANPVTHRLADLIHEAGGQVAVDGDGYSEQMHKMLPKIDVFIGSQFYYEALFGQSQNYRENLERVRKLGPRIVVFTLSEQGSVALWDKGYRFAPGYPVEVVDTVGAGDVYHGAYLYALLEGRDPGESAQFANAVAAIKCTGIGGRAHVPDRAMTEQFLREGTYDPTLLVQKTARYAAFSPN